MGLPPERALELLEELAATGVAQRDPELAGVYYVGVR
jgi:DNA-binding IclR family transcriptional regulator